MIALLFLLAFPPQGNAGGMLREEPVSLRQEGALLGWAKAREAAAEPFQCRPLADLPGTVLCVAATVKGMNSVLARISMFTEGVYGAKKGEVPLPGAKAHLTAMEFAGGHDLTGADIASFFLEAGRQCPAQPALCLSAEEEAFRAQVALPVQARYPGYVVIAVSAELGDDIPYILSHEVWHATFFLHGPYREAVWAYWNSLPAGERDRIREALSTIYDPSNELLMVNEFQAYLQQARAEEAALKDFHPRHAPFLKKIREKFRLPYSQRR